MRYEALVSEVMIKDVKTVPLGTSVREAAQIMEKYDIGSVIVMGERAIKGIVTSEDIVFKYVAKQMGERVEDIMTREVIGIEPNKTIEEAARLMAKNKIKRLPVIDAGKLVGIITASDLMRVQPGLYEILLERLKIRRPAFAEPTKGAQFFQCEICGNYSDEVEEIDGVWICPECEEFRSRRRGI
jgi:CBS domain-containing protein